MHCTRLMHNPLHVMHAGSTSFENRYSPSLQDSLGTQSSGIVLRQAPRTDPLTVLHISQLTRHLEDPDGTSLPPNGELHLEPQQTKSSADPYHNMSRPRLVQKHLREEGNCGTIFQTRFGRRQGWVSLRNLYKGSFSQPRTP